MSHRLWSCHFDIGPFVWTITIFEYSVFKYDFLCNGLSLWHRWTDPKNEFLMKIVIYFISNNRKWTNEGTIIRMTLNLEYEWFKFGNPDWIMIILIDLSSLPAKHSLKLIDRDHLQEIISSEYLNFETIQWNHSFSFISF